MTEGTQRRRRAARSAHESDGEAVADLLVHLKAIFEANGSRLMIVPIGSDS